MDSQTADENQFLCNILWFYGTKTLTSSLYQIHETYILSSKDNFYATLMNGKRPYTLYNILAGLSSINWTIWAVRDLLCITLSWKFINNRGLTIDRIFLILQFTAFKPQQGVLGIESMTTYQRQISLYAVTDRYSALYYWFFIQFTQSWPSSLFA